jgi:hypothetical protein
MTEDIMKSTQEIAIIMTMAAGTVATITGMVTTTMMTTGTPIVAGGGIMIRTR